MTTPATTQPTLAAFARTGCASPPPSLSLRSLGVDVPMKSPSAVAIRVSIVLAIGFLLSASAQVPENAPRPKPQFPDRKPPEMAIEKAVEIAHKELARRGTDLRGRFVYLANFVFDSERKPDDEAAKYGKGPYWYIELRDPKYSAPEYPVGPIRVLVFADGHVTIIVPE